MIDFDILLFNLSMWMTNMCHFDCSHVKHVKYYYKFFFPPVQTLDSNVRNDVHLGRVCSSPILIAGALELFTKLLFV